MKKIAWTTVTGLLIGLSTYIATYDNPDRARWLVMHCTATQPDADVEAIVRYWKEVNKWKKPGYHVLVDTAGTLHLLADLDEIVNGVGGYNSRCINIAYIGGVDKRGKPHDTRTQKQREAMWAFAVMIKQKVPEIENLGHRDFNGVKKACPSFDVKKEYRELSGE